MIRSSAGPAHEFALCEVELPDAPDELWSKHLKGGYMGYLGLLKGDTRSYGLYISKGVI